MTTDNEFGGFADADVVRGGGDSKLTFEFLVMEQIRRISKLGSDDWYGGYFSPAPIIIAAGSTSVDKEVYVKSTATAYLHSVNNLYDMLYGHVDESVHKVYAEYLKNLESEYEEHQLNMKAYADKQSLTENVASRLINDHNYLRAKFGRILFRAIMKWLKSVNFLKSSGYEEGTLDE